MRSRPIWISKPTGLWRRGCPQEDGGPGFRWRDYDDLSRRTDLFSAVIGEHTRFVSSQGQPLHTAIVSANYFEALGPAIHRGRRLEPRDASDSGNPAVLTDQAWARLFGRDPAALGRALDLNGRAFTIVGVLAPAFTGVGDLPRDVFVPMTPAWVAPRRDAANQTRETEILVRLQPGVSMVHAETALTPFMNEIIEEQEDVRAVVRPQPSPNALSIGMLEVLSPVFGAFVLVLVTACANVSNMMLARAIARHREMAVRLSIGASRGRLVRQLLTEGLLIAVLAGFVGLGLAAWGLHAAATALFSTLPPSVSPMLRLVPMTFDYRVFLFALAVAAAATLLFALLPALHASRIPLTDALRGQGWRRRSRIAIA